MNQSCIDHIFSNTPSKISSVTTHNHNNTNPTHNVIISDHLILTAIYNNKEIVVPQLYTTIRNNKLLTRERLQQLWDSIDIIKSTLYSADPKYISQCIINELSIIIETISPSKLIQCEKSMHLG